MDKQEAIAINTFALDYKNKLHDSYRYKLFNLYNKLYKEHHFTNICSDTLAVNVAHVLGLRYSSRPTASTFVVTADSPDEIKEFIEALDYYLNGIKQTMSVLRYIGTHVNSVDEFKYLISNSSGNIELDSFKEANQDKFDHLARVQLLSQLD